MIITASIMINKNVILEVQCKILGAVFSPVFGRGTQLEAEYSEDSDHQQP